MRLSWASLQPFSATHQRTAHPVQPVQENIVPRPSIDEIARRVLDALPHTAAGADTDLQRNLRAGLSGVLARMDLLSREEFDAQLRVLRRTREKVEALEQRVSELEQQIGPEHAGRS